MAKFTYTGEAPDGQITMYGVVFVPGTAAEVSDENAIRKLNGNRFFERDAAPSEDAKVKKSKPKKEVLVDGKPDETPVG